MHRSDDIGEETRGGVEQLDGDSGVSTDELQDKIMEEETLMLKEEVLLLDKEVILEELLSLGLNPEDNIEGELSSFKTLPVETEDKRLIIGKLITEK